MSERAGNVVPLEPTGAGSASSRSEWSGSSSAGRRALVQRSRMQRHQTTKPYRVLSTSKRWGTETRRYPDGTVVTVDTRPNASRETGLQVATLREGRGRFR